MARECGGFTKSVSLFFVITRFMRVIQFPFSVRGKWIARTSRAMTGTNKLNFCNARAFAGHDSGW
jgi:hypothetical protein